MSGHGGDRARDFRATERAGAGAGRHAAQLSNHAGAAADIRDHGHGDRDGAAAGRRPAAREDSRRRCRRRPAQDIEASGALDLSDFLNRRFNGVHVNEIQGNPFQPDVNYRGYTASPLLGTPQGLSVYMDGVRLNQPFGDVVSWDLIPRLAIASTTLMPGSNPLFGLNTLGGALSIQTKDGRNDARHDRAGDLRQRRAARRRVRARRHASRAGCTGTSPAISSPRTAGATTRRRTSASCSASSAGSAPKHDVGADRWRYADNSLNGNGLQEQRFLDRDYASVYTKPDITDNRVDVPQRRRRGTALERRADVVRQRLLPRHPTRTRSTATSTKTRSTRRSISRRRRAGGARRRRLHRLPDQRRQRGQHAVSVLALHRQRAAQRRAGREVQRPDQPHATRRSTTAAPSGSSRGATRSRAASNQFTAGGGYDRSRVGFAQSTELGYLNPDRSVTGVDAFGDGVTGGEVDGEPFDTRVDLDGLIQTWSLYATDTLSIARRVARHAVGPLQPHDGAQSRPHRARRRAGLARRRPHVQPLQSGGRRDVQPVARRSTSTPATAKAAARRRRSSSAAPTRTSRASCRTRWPAIRRSTRS